MLELKGSLAAMGMPAVIQLIGELHHSGSLELSKGFVRGVLGFEGGRLVAAEFELEHGLAALAACTMDLADADFRFVEGEAAGERTLDLGPGDLQQLLVRLANGETASEAPPAVLDEQQRPVPLANGEAATEAPPAVLDEQQRRVPLANGEAATEAPPAVLDDQPRVPGVCPMLGFADDRARHYSRPTALHRCYATLSPSLVNSQEQVDLCLGGLYPTCPRWRNKGDRSTAAGTMALEQAARKPTPSIAERQVPAEAAPTVHVERRSPPATRRRLPLGRWLPAVVGLIGIALLVALPALGGRRAASPAPVASRATAAAPTLAGLPTSTAAGPVASGPTSAAPAVRPTLAPTVAAPVQPTSAAVGRPTPAPTVATVARPTQAPTVPQAAAPTAVIAPQTQIVSTAPPLLDARFAAGPADNWPDNPPFAAWRDGAYRLQVENAAQFVALGVPINRVLTDVSVSGTFRKTGGPPGGGYGLIVRDQGPLPRDGVNQEANAYVLEAGDLGEFGVWRRAGDRWIDLVPWTRSSTVRAGGSPNDLTATASGDRLTFTINGVQVASVQDAALSSGGVGVFVGGDYNQVALDHFAVQLPQ